MQGTMDEGPLTPLHPNHVKVLRLTTLMVALPAVIAALIIESSGIVRPGVIVLPVAVIAGLLVLRLPWRRYHARGYTLGQARLRVVRGLLFRSDTVVPFGRVQHIDVNRGPIERYYGLATLVLHTAGSHNASVALPGLAEADALAMRETIRGAIERDTL